MENIVLCCECRFSLRINVVATVGHILRLKLLFVLLHCSESEWEVFATSPLWSFRKQFCTNDWLCFSLFCLEVLWLLFNNNSIKFQVEQIISLHYFLTQVLFHFESASPSSDKILLFLLPVSPFLPLSSIFLWHALRVKPSLQDSTPKTTLSGTITRLGSIILTWSKCQYNVILDIWNTASHLNLLQQCLTVAQLWIVLLNMKLLQAPQLYYTCHFRLQGELSFLKGYGSITTVPLMTKFYHVHPVRLQGRTWMHVLFGAAILIFLGFPCQCSCRPDCLSLK